jgi:hypothetical protein
LVGQARDAAKEWATNLSARSGVIRTSFLDFFEQNSQNNWLVPIGARTICKGRVAKGLIGYNRAIMRNIALLSFGLTLAGCVHASTCVTTTLDAYLVPAFSCDIGPYTVKDFDFGAIAGNNVLILDTDITVTPAFTPLDKVSLTFASAKFSVSGSEAAHYAIEYFWDATPVHSMDDVLTDPTVAPALAKVTTSGCENAAFGGTLAAPTCGTTVQTVTVFDDGISPVLFDIHTFSPPLSPGNLGMYNKIEIDANGASSSFKSFTNALNVPEPSTLTGGLIGLAIALCASRLKRR